MHSTFYTLYITKDGLGLAGLNPVVQNMHGLSTGQNTRIYQTVDFPSIFETGDGFYFIEIDWDTWDPGSHGDEVFLLKIDADENDQEALSQSERYITIRLEKDDHLLYTLDAKADSITAKLNRLVDIEQGSWEISDNQLKMSKSDGTLLVTFDLFDRDGNPTEGGPFKREQVFVEDI